MPRRIAFIKPRGQPSRQERDRLYNTRGRDQALAELYGGANWKRFRAMIKAGRVLCEPCQERGLTVVGEIVHHLRDPRDHPDGTFDESNVQLVCRSCHNRIHKTGE